MAGQSRDLIEQAIAQARAGQTARFEAFCPTAKGTPRWWDVNVSPLRRPDGVIDGFIATSRDITDRVKQSALRDAIADEMRHRLRNNYVVVGSLLSAYARGKPEQQDFAREMVDRLTSLGIAQTMRAMGSESCLLDQLVPALVQPYATPDCPIHIGDLPAVAPRPGAGRCARAGARRTRGQFDQAWRLERARHRYHRPARSTDGQIRLTWSETSDRKVESRAATAARGFA